MIRAQQTLAASLARCAGDPAAAVELGAVLTELGRYDEARAQLDTAAARAATGLRADAMRVLEADASAARALKPDHARALESYRAAMVADAASDHARARDGFLDAWRKWPERAEYLVDAGLSARRGGDPVNARRLFDRASSIFESRFGALSLQPELLPGYSSSSIHPTMSSDGKYLVVSSGDDVFVFDSRTWTVRSHFLDRSYPKPIAARLSPDNSVIAIGNGNQTLQLVDAVTGTLLATSKGHTNWLLDVAFSPDGRAVATSSEDKTVRVWEVPSGRLLLTLAGHEGPTRRIAFSPDGSMIVSTSDDRTARLWSARDGKLLRILKGHDGSLRGLAFRHDGRQVATSSEDKTVRLWDSETGREMKVLRGHTGAVWRVAFSPDGSRIASIAADNTARVWNASTGELLRTIRSSTPDKTTAMRGDTDSQEPEDTLRLASLGGLPVLGGGGGTSGPASVVVVDIFYRADGKLMAFDIDHTARSLAARLWDVEADRSMHEIRSRETISAALSISSDGKRLAQAFYAGTVRLWDLEGAASHPLVRVSDRALRSVAWLSGHASLAAGDSDGRLYLVDPSGAAAPRLLGRHDSEVGGIGASADGTTLVSVSQQGEVKVWSLPEGKLLRTLEKSEARSYGPCSLSADGKLLAVGRGFQGPAIVDTTTPSVLAGVKAQLVAKLIGFGADGSVVQLGEDGTLAVLDPRTGEVTRNEPGKQSFHFCDWIRAQNPQAPCVDDRGAPLSHSTAGMRLPLLIAVHAGVDLAASRSIEGLVDVWRPGRPGVAARLVGVGDRVGACAMKDGNVELFGEDAGRLLSCTWGGVRMPFEVCEDKYGESGLLARAMKR